MNRQTNPLQKMKPTDILAGIVILGSFTLIGLGHDGVINSVLMAVVAFYFGIKTSPPKE
ncbi:MAG: hypothetical protein UW86_C0011G0008 [Microgenomates group bacterium GW2011_GWA1_Microgenomates_45_10]|nr:MAG: hypothetical protein UW86_C0011G0008 [Microgenomates group bacterium GW2011_GWA1_Microgenomates_45_10]